MPTGATQVPAGADLIIGLGYDTVEVEYEAWIGDRPLLQIDIEPVDIAPSVQLDARGDRRPRFLAVAAYRAAGRQQHLDRGGAGRAPP